MNTYKIDCSMSGIVISATIKAPDPVAAIQQMFRIENMPSSASVHDIRCERVRDEGKSS